MAAAIERLQKTARDNPLAAVAAAATAAVAAPAVARGLKLTTAFLASLRTSKRHGRIDGYNDLHNKEEADARNDQYADLVDSYYDLATEFYEWGWGACFHFADRRGTQKGDGTGRRETRRNKGEGKRDGREQGKRTRKTKANGERAEKSGNGKAGKDGNGWGKIR